MPTQEHATALGGSQGFEERRSVVVNGEARLAVFEYGSPTDETLVLVHGWPDTHHVWTDVINRLSDRFHVVAYDVRCHGESTGPEGVKAFRLEALADDLFAVIDAVSPNKPIHLIGHDWGSVTGWEAVCEERARGRIASFTSISGPNLDHFGKIVHEAVRRPTPRKLALVARQMLSSSYAVIESIPWAAWLVFGYLGFPRVWAGFLWLTEGMPRKNLVLSNTLRRDMITARRYYPANLLQRVLRPRERRTDLPVLLILNERDIAVRPAIYDNTGKWATNLRVKKFPTGHWLPYARPDLIASEAESFIQELAQGGGTPFPAAACS